MTEAGGRTTQVVLETKCPTAQRIEASGLAKFSTSPAPKSHVPQLEKALPGAVSGMDQASSPQGDEISPVQVLGLPQCNINPLFMEEPQEGVVGELDQDYDNYLQLAPILGMCVDSLLQLWSPPPS